MSAALEIADLELAGAARVFTDGSRRAAARLGGLDVGRGVYLPGWRWTRHARPAEGGESQAHTGYVLSGRLAVRAADGSETEVGPGQAFHVGPGHDAWVVGDEPCVALDFTVAPPSPPGA
ncbi:MAG: cupin domain-containing protein [Gaiellaceae bacterium]